MSAHKNDNFNDRLTTAAKAKSAALAKFRTRPGPDDAVVRERQAALTAIATAREARMAERQRAREAEAARQAEELALQQAAERALKVEEAKRAAEEVARVAALAVEQKAARDARYAARQGRRR